MKKLLLLATILTSSFAIANSNDCDIYLESDFSQDSKMEEMLQDKGYRVFIELPSFYLDHSNTANASLTKKRTSKFKAAVKIGKYKYVVNRTSQFESISVKRANTYLKRMAKLIPVCK